jgi:cell division protease FtsH
MAAEAIVFGETTTGPGNDLEQVTEIAQRMVCEYGMSSVVGPVVLRKGEGLTVDARDVTRRPVSEMTAAEVDREVRRLVDEGFQTARKILEQRRPTLNLIAETLIADETLQGERLLSLLDGRPDPGVATAPPSSDEQPASGTRLGPHRPETAA